LLKLYHEKAEMVWLETLNHICQALGCTITDLLEYVPDRKQQA